MIRWLIDFFPATPNMAAAEGEVTRRRDAAICAAKDRRKRDPGFVVPESRIIGAEADEETRKLMRRLAGV